MFGLGFLNGVFLFALGALALPIIIHILNRRRLRRVPFSSLEFILDMSRRRMSKVNLRRWIILLLRTLAIVLMVLAFARPTMRAGAGLFMPGQAPKSVVICIDVSGSMSAELRTGTVLQRAQEIAADVVDETGRNDVINVVTFSTRSEVLFEGGTRNKQIVKSAIGASRATNEATELSEAVETAVRLVGESGITNGEIYVVSDFREASDSLVVSEVPDHVRLIFLPVYDGPIDNVSIDRVFTPRKLIRPGEVVKVSVALSNHSRENPADFSLELVVGGKRKAEKVVNLSPASSSTVTFSISLNEWGTHRCRISKDHDRLAVDDDRYFLIEVSRRIPVTLIRGRRFAEDGRQAAAYFYVEKAINPRASGEGEFSVTVLDENEVTMSSLPKKGVLVWTEPRQLDRHRFQLLRQYVSGGGAAMVFLGTDRQGSWRDEDFRRYLGMDRVTPKTSEEGEHLVSFAKDHPIFSLFNEEELELLSRSRMRHYLQVTGVAPDSILAYLGSGDPGIWECSRGRGRLLVVAAAPDMPGGDLPLSPMFLPLIHTSVSYLASTETTEFHRENYAGTDLVFDLLQWGPQSTQLRVVDERGTSEKPLLFESPQGETKAMVARPREVGFYSLRADTAIVAQAAVNIDTRESNLNPQPLSEDELGGARVIEASSHFAESLLSEKQGREIYAAFLILAVCALVLESVLGRNA